MATSKNLQQMMFGDSEECMSSVAEGFGISPSIMQDGETGQSGPEAAPALVSRAQGKAEGLMTLVTSGLIGTDSSRSVALQSSLVSKLMTRLDTGGSILFKQTWKRKRTPLGRWYSEHTALGRPTSGRGSTSLQTWRTPAEGDSIRGVHPSPDAKAGQHSLNTEASLASWPTPDCHPDLPNSSTNRGKDYGGCRPRLTPQGLGNVAALASWPTPQAHDTKGERGNSEAERHPSPHDLTNATALAAWATPNCPAPHDTDQTAGRARPREGYGADLPIQAGLAAWATPKERDYRSASRPADKMDEQLSHPRGQDLNVEATLATWPTPTGTDSERRGYLNEDTTNVTLNLAAQLAGFGEMPTGFLAAIQKYPEALSGGQLSPEHSAWLMGIPEEWATFVSQAMQSLSRKRKSSSKATSTP